MSSLSSSLSGGGVKLAGQVPQTKLSEREQTQPIVPPTTPKSDPRTPRNLLQKAFKHSAVSLSSQPHIRQEYLLETPIGRDFALVTTAGVEFKIHSTMLIGGPKTLQEGLFPGGLANPSPPTLVTLPPHFHPMLVDRFVSFLYRGCYSLDKHSTATRLHHATHVPDTSSPEVYAMRDCPGHMFHLRMCTLAEELEYEALFSTAHAKLFELMSGFCPSHIKGLVDATFAPLGSATRICKDEHGYMQQLVVVATLSQELKQWTDLQKKQLADLLQGEEYVGFWEMCKILKEQNEDVMKFGPKSQRSRIDMRMRKPTLGAHVLAKTPDVSRVLKRTAAKDRKKAATLAKILNADGDGDFDMEVD